MDMGGSGDLRVLHVGVLGVVIIVAIVSSVAVGACNS